MAATKTPPKEATVPAEIIDRAKQNPAQASQFSRGRVSALGVLAELESIEPILARHRQESQARLASSLNQKVRTILPALGIKSTNEEQFLKIVAEISQETARQSLEDVAQVQNREQLPEVVADSLAQTLLVHSETESQIKQIPEAIFQKAYKNTKDLTPEDLQALEQAAVLGNLAQIAEFKKPDQRLQATVADATRKTIETESQLTPPEAQDNLQGNHQIYLTEYVNELNKQLTQVSPAAIPTLAQLQKAKEAAHQETTKITNANLSKTLLGRNLVNKIGAQKTTAILALKLGLLPLPTPPISASLSPIASFALATEEGRQEVISAALANDQQWLAQELKETNAQLEDLKKQRSLSFKETKVLRKLQGYYSRLVTAQADHIKKSRRLQGLTSFITKPFKGNMLPFSQTVQYLIKSEGGYVAPALLLYGQKFGSDILLRHSAATLGLNLGISFSLPKIPSLGMGIAKVKGFTPQTIVLGTIAGVGAGLLKRVIKTGSQVLGGLGLYFLGLGQAVFTGFVIGATIGGIGGAIGGAIAGAQIGAAIGTAIFPGVGTVIGAVVGGIIGGTIGFFAGAIVGGIAGGLTALGLATGSTTVAATGIGMATGATIGFALGGPIGALAGAALGAAAGYLVGSYVIPFAKSAFGAFTSGAGTVGGGLLSGAIGLVSTLFNGIISLGGAALGLVSSLGTSLLGIFGLGGSAAISPLALASIVIAPVGTISILGVITIITTGTAFIAISDEGIAVTPGENEFFTLTKTVDKEQLTNPPPPQTATFTIKLEAKSLALTNITITDELKVQAINGNFTLPQDPCSTTIPAKLDPGQSWECQIVITADNQAGRDYTDGVVANTVNVTITPEGQPQQTESVTAVVVVGTPPADCPRRWPAIGFISQGPEGATSHGNPAFGQYEALDIAQNIGNDVFATVEGTVDFIYTARGDRNDQRVRIRPTSCTGLTTVNYWHLSAVSVSQGQTVTFGQKIGKTGAWNGAPHIHYQFNEVSDRSFEIKSPYVPTTVPRTCDGYEACGKVDITSAP